jgi:hypothetical protein
MSPLSYENQMDRERERDKERERADLPTIYIFYNNEIFILKNTGDCAIIFKRICSQSQLTFAGV